VPELPDVEVFRRRLAASGLRRRIDRVDVRDSRLLRKVQRERLRRALEGRRLSSTRRHGKHLFVRITGEGWLVMHFGMTGRLDHVRKDERDPPHTRLSLHFVDGSAVHLVDQRRLGFVTLTDDPDRYADDERLGPDAVSLGLAEFRDAVRSYRGAVKAALMEQSVMAGIGNIYSDEILFHARIDPRDKTAALDDRALQRLHRQTGRVLGLAADRGADPERVPSTWLLPHREDGVSCPRGRGTVRKIKLAGRGAFYCPECQGR
jgi:formamidopyrimidine-DNA glycosylase